MLQASAPSKRMATVRVRVCVHVRAFVGARLCARALYLCASGRADRALMQYTVAHLPMRVDADVTGSSFCTHAKAVLHLY